MSDSRGDGRVPSLRHLFNSHAINLLLRYEGLPENYDDIPNLNVYDAGEKRGAWKQYLKDKGQAWIITPLYYRSGPRSRFFRKASGGDGWNGHGPLPLKKNVDASWVKRKYTLETKEGTGPPTYTMIEYLPAQDKPTHALCRITVDNKNIVSSQQREGKVLDRIESKKLPTASPKKHSTEAPVSNTRKRGRCSYTNTMEEGTSTQGQKQVKVEIFEPNTYRDKPTNLSCDTNRNCLEKNDEQGRNTLSSCNTDDCIKLEDLPLDSQLRYQQLLAEVNALIKEPNQLSHNFDANSTVAMDYKNRPEPYPSTGNFATTEGRLDHQMFESDAYVTTEPGLDTNNNATTEPEDMDWRSYLDLSD